MSKAAPLTEQEVYELRRVLLSFKEGLPAHELGHWYIELRYSDKRLVENEDPPGFSRCGYTIFFGSLTVGGEGVCARCGRTFKTDDVFLGLQRDDADDEQRLAKAVASAKDTAVKKAELGGPCWGGIPEPDDLRSYAVLD